MAITFLEFSSELPENTTPTLTDEVVGLQSGINKRTTLQKIQNLFKTNAIQTVTRTELQALITASDLAVGAMYLITDATSTNISLIVTAKAVNALFENCVMLNDRFDIMLYDINTDIFQGIDNLACVIRNIAGTWAFIDDANHKPRGFSSVSQNASFFTATYTRTDYNKVLSLIGAPDEVYSEASVFCGASVGLQFCEFILKQDFTVMSYIQYNGSSWTLSGSYGVTSATFNSGVLTINHNDVGAGFGVSAIVRGGNYRCNISSNSIGSTTTEINFIDTAGNIVTTPNTNMKILFSRSVSRALIPSLAGLTSSNIWVYGQMMKQIL